MTTSDLMREMVPDLDCLADEFGLDNVIYAWEWARVFVEKIQDLRANGLDDDACALLAVLGGVIKNIVDSEFLDDGVGDEDEEEVEHAIVPE
jgi:hypothetical protein